TGFGVRKEHALRVPESDNKNSGYSPERGYLDLSYFPVHHKPDLPENGIAIHWSGYVETVYINIHTLLQQWTVARKLCWH
ncbi:hypothetical protein, partial [Klebsiella pneumoniae]|uniref:hypothetical protein n=1 Tax=Klebsiella pneumoniae TaxID=573 RepID=UPI0019D70DC8